MSMCDARQPRALQLDTGHARPRREKDTLPQDGEAFRAGTQGLAPVLVFVGLDLLFERLNLVGHCVCLWDEHGVIGGCV